MLNAIMRDGLVNVPVKILGFTSDEDGETKAVFVDAYKDSPYYNQIQDKYLWDGKRWRFILTPEDKG